MSKAAIKHARAYAAALRKLVTECGYEASDVTLIEGAAEVKARVGSNAEAAVVADIGSLDLSVTDDVVSFDGYIMALDFKAPKGSHAEPYSSWAMCFYGGAL